MMRKITYGLLFISLIVLGYIVYYFKVCKLDETRLFLVILGGFCIDAFAIFLLVVLDTTDRCEKENTKYTKVKK